MNTASEHFINSTGLNTIVTIIGIIVGITSIVSPIISGQNAVWITVGFIVGIVILTLVFVKLSINRKLFLNQDAFWKYVENEYYIPIEITDPKSNNPEKRLLFFEHIIKIIKEKNVEDRFICLLGDIGSGKTDALVHLFLKYVKRYSFCPSMPSNIKLYTMNIGYKELKERIEEDIPSKRERGKTILLLDALDECDEARDSLINTQENNPSIFMDRLAQYFKDFAWVMVSCRKQFFLREEFYPDKINIRVGNRYPDPFQHWHKLYIEPLNDKQVENYLAKRWETTFSTARTDEVQRIIVNDKETFQRPLLLTYLNELVEAKNKTRREKPFTTKEVFDIIILFWIKKESDNDATRTAKLLQASLCMTAYMYRNKLNYLDEVHYKALCEEYRINDADKLLRVKSLLKNSQTGYSFVHQSFYEHLLAYWFFLHPEDIGSINGLLDSTIKIYNEIWNTCKNKKEATEISQILKTGGVLKNQVALGFYKFGNALYDIYHYNEAEPLFNETLEIYKELNQESQGLFLDGIAATLNILANLFCNTNRRPEGIEKAEMALGIYRKLVEKNPAFLPHIAMLLNNLGVLHWKEKHPQKAENEYQEALGYYRQLAEKNPDIYLPYVANLLINLGIVHGELNNNKAEDDFRETLVLYRQLAEKNPDAYLPGLATLLHNLAGYHYHKRSNPYHDVLNEFLEALRIRRLFAEKEMYAYLPDVADTLYNIALLHLTNGVIPDAKKAAEESLQKFQKMAEVSPAAFEDKVERGIILLDDIQRQQSVE